MKKLLVILLSIAILTANTACSKKQKDVTISVLSDLHYASNAYYLYTGDYAEMNDTSGTGKQMKYLDTIFDAFIEQLKNEPTDYLVLSGDLAYVGAKGSHLELAKKLAEIEENGTQVLVLPGNHDIVRNAWDAVDGNPAYTASVTPEEFQEVYKEFGFGEAISMDQQSMSYVIDTKKGARIFMLDSNLTYGIIYGKFLASTLAWIDEQLQACVKAGDTPVMVSHHNLLVHNDRFVMGYQIGNSEELLEIMKKNGADLYLSGHLHPQHISSNEVATEIASGAFSVYPHHYGVVSIDNEGWEYNCYKTDVEGYAKAKGFMDENLLNYNKYGYDFFYQNAIRDGRLNGIDADEVTLAKIHDYASQVNVQFFAGELTKVDRTYENLFRQYTEGTFWGDYINKIMEEPTDFVYATNKK